MRRVLAAALLALAGPASAQIFSETGPAWAPGVIPYFGAVDGSYLAPSSQTVVSAPLSATGCFASPFVSGKTILSITRAGSRLCPIQAGELTCTANQACVAEDGLLVEPARTQLYPTPSAPAAGTATATVATTHQFWVVGSGSQQISAGTATATGLPCTATEASPCTFTVTVTGTLSLAAVTGTLTRAQIEAGAFRTTWISAGTRSNDVVTVSTPPMFSSCVSVDAKAGSGRTWSAAVGPFVWGTAGAANSSSLAFSTNIAYWAVRDASNLSKDSRITFDSSRLTDGSAHTLTSCMDGSGNLQALVDGLSAGVTTTVTGSGVWTAPPTTLTLGRYTSNGDWSGYLKNFKITRTGNPRIAVTVSPLSVVALGDSITQGTTCAAAYSYSSKLQTDKGNSWWFTNSGVNGNTTLQMKSRWLVYGPAMKPGYLVVLGGTNDVATRTSAEILQTLTEIYDSAFAAGSIPVPVLIMPYSARTAPQRTLVAEVNAGIAAYATAHGINYVDAWTAFDDGSGAMIAGYTCDGLHLNTAGTDVMASIIGAQIP